MSKFNLVKRCEKKLKKKNAKIDKYRWKVMIRLFKKKKKKRSELFF